jgi:hypothetical protein
MYFKRFLGISVFAVVISAILGVGQARAATLTVDDDHAQCPGAAFTSIQTAVDAASPGDKINVCPGTYQEQVDVHKPLTISGVDIAGQNLATIRPAPAVANSTSLVTGNPIAAIILVNGTNNVTLTNLTVDGATNGINACSPNLIGVYYRNASGKIDNLAVKNIKLGPGFEGCQSGLAIFVQSGSGGMSKVDILNSSVHDYQKNGITANEVGTEANIKGNAVTGIDSDPYNAQNGIQVAFGARGTVDNNSVINHIYSGGDAATNIIIYASDNVKVTNNNLGNAQINTYVFGNRAEVTNNTIFQTRLYDGIALIGNLNKGNNNRIFNSDESAVYVLGDRNEAKGNTINETPVGVLIDSASTNTNTDGNHYFNTGMNTAPTAGPLASALLKGGLDAGSSRQVRSVQP